MKTYAMYRARVPWPDEDQGLIFFDTFGITGMVWNVTVGVRVKKGTVTGYTASFPLALGDKLTARLKTFTGPNVKTETDGTHPTHLIVSVGNPEP
jgi:hypothetical protein